MAQGFKSSVGVWGQDFRFRVCGSFEFCDLDG